MVSMGRANEHTAHKYITIIIALFVHEGLKWEELLLLCAQYYYYLYVGWCWTLKPTHARACMAQLELFLSFKQMEMLLNLIVFMDNKYNDNVGMERWLYFYMHQYYIWEVKNDFLFRQKLQGFFLSNSNNYEHTNSIQYQCIQIIWCFYFSEYQMQCHLQCIIAWRTGNIQNDRWEFLITHDFHDDNRTIEWCFHSTTHESVLGKSVRRQVNAYCSFMLVSINVEYILSSCFIVDEFFRKCNI